MWMFRGLLGAVFLFFGPWPTVEPFLFSSIGHAVRYLLFVLDPWCGEKKV